MEQFAIVDTVEARWPSGATEKFTGLAANTFIRLTEGKGMSKLNRKE